MTRKKVSVYRHRNRRHLLFEQVPALVCRACGHRLFEADAIEAMEHCLHHPPAKKRKANLVILPV